MNTIGRLAELLGLGVGSTALVSLAAWVDDKDRGAFLALLQMHANDGGAATREFTLKVPPRGQRIFRCSIGWIKETGQICACLDDVTDQRLLERKLLRQEKQSLLDTLVGGIAHELNNKLTPVMGYAELLGSGASGEAANYSTYINKSVAEAAHIIRQLLQLSKPSMPVMRPVDLRAVLEETLVMLRFQVRQAECELRTIFPSEAVWVLGDPGQLKQVLINLVLNALQALEPRGGGGVTIEVRTEGRTAWLGVTDTGCGIPAENLGRIFDPFFTTKGPERGSGLGLSICYSIVRQHGGDIAVESRWGEGARFVVTLPCEHPGAVVVTDSEIGGPPVASLTVVAQGERVLVVEDEDVVRKLLQEMLRTQFGCQVDFATNGVEAPVAIEREDYALVISDIQMPVMNGTELYRRLREQGNALTGRFVFITGYSGARRIEEEIAQWNVPVIAKPFTLTRLGSVCRPFLQTSTASPANV